MIKAGVSQLRHPYLGAAYFPAEWNGAAGRVGDSFAQWLTGWRLAVLLGCHGLLGLTLRSVPGAPTLYSIGVLVAAVGLALFGARLAWIAWAMSYVVGAEVLWRMCETALPYESSKYTICVLTIITLVRMRRYSLPRLAVCYLALLAPGILISYNSLSGEALRAGVSFNLSGPLSLCFAVCFFANISLTPEEWKIMLLSAITPIMGIITIAAHGVFTNPDIQFATESVHDASGGFGPNQVSAILGLGALLAVHYVLNSTDLTKQLVLVSAALLFLMQAAFTFSRGGIFAAFLAFLPALFFRLRLAGKRSRLVLWTLVLIAICGLVIYPFVDNYTGGALTARYTVKDLNGREALMMADYQIWERSPWFGVGIGGSPRAHYELFGHPTATHNEFTRILAEHGVFGIAAAALVLVMAGLALMRAPTWEERAYVSSFALWSILFCASNGMRIAAAGFVFGLAFIRLKQSRSATIRYSDGPLPESLWLRS